MSESRCREYMKGAGGQDCLESSRKLMLDSLLKRRQLLIDRRRAE